ncbi:hypothetical protein [Cellvibrio mixtus]|uniref:hypothetical protein n=1 Tax=Cellvibrio mixtus TaxID=39650 RepID=UPI0005869337|nr:hypothetical protein [Cellvibrio mixtus]
MKTKSATRPRRLRTHVMVTLADDQRAKIEAIAKAEERSMTSVCRLLVIDALERRESPRPTCN